MTPSEDREPWEDSLDAAMNAPGFDERSVLRARVAIEAQRRRLLATLLATDWVIHRVTVPCMECGRGTMAVHDHGTNDPGRADDERGIGAVVQGRWPDYLARVDPKPRPTFTAWLALLDPAIDLPEALRAWCPKCHLWLEVAVARLSTEVNIARDRPEEGPRRVTGVRVRRPATG